MPSYSSRLFNNYKLDTFKDMNSKTQQEYPVSIKLNKILPDTKHNPNKIRFQYNDGSFYVYSRINKKEEKQHHKIVLIPNASDEDEKLFVMFNNHEKIEYNYKKPSEPSELNEPNENGEHSINETKIQKFYNISEDSFFKINKYPINVICYE